MKKSLFIIVFLMLNQINLFAQDPINVQITGTFESISGIYSYDGLLSGKNKYSREVTFEGNTFIASVALLENTNIGTVWVLRDNLQDASGDYGIAFYNTTVPAGLMPPSTGWLVAGEAGSTGTMTIDTVLSLNENEVNDFSFYPNPAVDYTIIKSTNNLVNSFKYEIVDLTGKQVKSGSVVPNEKLNVEFLEAGNYLFRVKDEKDNVSNLKFIKQ